LYGGLITVYEVYGGYMAAYGGGYGAVDCMLTWPATGPCSLDDQYVQYSAKRGLQRGLYEHVKYLDLTSKTF